MHELSIALGIVDGALAEVDRRGGGRISAVHLRIGRLSGVDKDALLFSYPIVCEDTLLKDSELVIEEVDVLIYCPACKATRSPKILPMLMCAECGAYGDRVIQGDELEIFGLEFADG